MAALRPDNFNLGRIHLKEPSPISRERGALGVGMNGQSGGLMEGAFGLTTQINRNVEREAQDRAAPGHAPG